jgi:hypothetical protein
MSGNYEFSETENTTFQGLVSGMKRSGSIVILAALILAGYNMIQWLEISLGSGGVPPKWVHNVDYALWILMSVIGIAIGFLLIKATTGFIALINTQGDDINHLMQSVTKLSGILKIVFVAALVGAIMLSLSLVLLVMYS